MRASNLWHQTFALGTCAVLATVVTVTACGSDDPEPAPASDAGTFQADTGTTPTADSGATSRCGTGTTECSARCVDTALDPSNCGACGKKCAAGEVCSGGTCGLACNGALTKCGDKCVDTKSDPANCGACAAGGDAGAGACGTGQACVSGACTAACSGAAINVCGSKCVDFKADANNCGGCGNLCPTGATCSNGQCGCPVGQNVCTSGTSGSCAASCANNTLPKSCLEVKQKNPFVKSGVTKIDPDGAGAIVPFDVYCDQDSDGGGWTLVAKVDGTDATLNYESTFWTVTDTADTKYTVNTASADLSTATAKLLSYNTVPVTSVRLAFANGGLAKGVVLSLSTQANSLLDAMSPNVAINTGGPTRDRWLASASPSSLEYIVCAQGLNQNPAGGAFARVRIGAAANNEDDCATPDSAIGFGISGSSCGQISAGAGAAARCAGVNGDIFAPQFGYIFVRAEVTDFTAKPVRASCKAHLQAGEKVSGKYRVTLGGNTENVWCDMTTDGGGWTVFASYTGANGEIPMVADTDNVAGNPLAYGYYTLNRAKKVAIHTGATETLFRRSDAWLKMDKPLFDATLTTADTTKKFAVKLTASDGVTTGGYAGWHNGANIVGGGDVGITVGPAVQPTCSGTMVDGFDNHSSTFRMLNCTCQYQTLYSYSAVSGDGDVGYDVGMPVGAWSTTRTCSGGEGGGLSFYAAVR